MFIINTLNSKIIRELTTIFPELLEGEKVNKP